MPTMLTLGVRPRRDPRALFEALLWPRGVPAAPHPMVGDRVVTASTDVDPATLDLTGIDRLSIDVPVDLVDDMLLVRVKSQLTVFCDGSPDVTARISAAGMTPGLLTGRSDDERADFLAVIAHAAGGFVARASTAAEVLEIVAGTVAALRGDYIRDALSAPDVAALTTLHPDAAAATREVLLGIEVDDPATIVAELEKAIGETT